MATYQAPSRSNTQATDEDAVPVEDSSEVTRLFTDRLVAYRGAVGYLEDYIIATERAQHSQSKELDRILKTVSHPLKNGHHFDQSLGGIAGMFDNIRSNTQGILTSHSEAASSLKRSVIPTFSRLQTEIRNKEKEIAKGAGRGHKAVDKARSLTQRQIELLGQYTAAFDSAGGKVGANEDPYVLQRLVYHRLHKQITEENSNRQDLLAVQSNFAQFEGHVLRTIQTGMGNFMQVVIRQAEHSKSMYGDMVATSQRVPLDFEWKGFVKRNSEILIDPSVPARSLSNVNFPNQDHLGTVPLIAGSLERKSKVLKRFEPGYYAVTPAKFLHEYKTDDNFTQEPVPESSLYLPDCTIGALDGTVFIVKGKDVSHGRIGSTFTMAHEFCLRAHTDKDAHMWWEIIRSASGQITTERPTMSVPNTPVDATTTANDLPIRQKEVVNQPMVAQPGVQHVGSQHVGAQHVGAQPVGTQYVMPKEHTVPSTAGTTATSSVVEPGTATSGTSLTGTTAATVGEPVVGKERVNTLPHDTR